MKTLLLYFVTLVVGEESLPKNVPDALDVNRFHDGFASISPYTSTSPSFMPYTGEWTSDFDSRPHDDDSPLVTSSVVFQVDAKVRWNGSKLRVLEWGSYRFSAVGSWFDWNAETSAVGYECTWDATYGCCSYEYPHGKECLLQVPRIATVPYMHLVCCVGDGTYNLLSSATQERWIPFDEATMISTCFPVKNDITWKASLSGQLFCYANDSEGMYWNNHGTLTVTVQKV